MSKWKEYIVAAISDRNLALRREGSRPKINVRVGINTGQTLIGAVGAGDWKQDHEIIGKAPNLAARIQSLTKPNSVVISEATFNLIAGLFEVQPLGPTQIKGLSEPVELFQVLGIDPSGSRFSRHEVRSRLPMIGREDERSRLINHWNTTRDLRVSRSVLVSGDAGISARSFDFNIDCIFRVSSAPWTNFKYLTPQV
jgi:Adenylate and Guanylate cyclase catalytic domain